MLPHGIRSLATLSAIVVLSVLIGSCTPGATATPTPTATTAPRVVTPTSTPTTAAPTAQAPTPTPTTAVRTPTPTATTSAPTGQTPTPTATAARPTPTATPQPTNTPTPLGKEPKKGGVAVFAHRGDPSGWDPGIQTSITLRNVAAPIWGEGSLVRQCRDDIFKICPQFAESWQANADFTQWTFKIRDNLVWHDGKPMTAEDVRWWLDLTRSGLGDRRPAVQAAIFKDVQKTEVVDGNQLRVTLGVPAPRFLSFVSAQIDLHIAYPKHLAEPEILQKGNPKVSPDQIGYVAAGPFKMESYSRGSIVRVRRFDRYWEKDDKGRALPFLDGIDFPIIKDPATMVAGFRTKRLDGTARGTGFFITPEQQKSITQDMGKDAWFARIGAYPDYLGINTTVKPWDDVRVRQAVHLWFDRQDGIKALYSGEAALRAFWVQGSPFANPDIAEWPGYSPATKQADRQRAKALLTEAGFPNGFKTKMMCRDVWVERCEWMVSQLGGLLGQANATMEVVDTATRTDRLVRGAWEVDAASPQANIFPEDSFGDWNMGNDVGVARHTDPKVDEYFRKLLGMADGDERNRVAREMEVYVAKEKLYAIPLWMTVGTIAFRNYVSGMPVPPVCSSCSIDNATVWLDK